MQFAALSVPFGMSGMSEMEISRPVFRQAQTSSQDEARLAEILEKSAVYCDRLKNSALHFVCREKIEEVFSRGMADAVTRPGVSLMGRSRWGSQKNNFVYDYQLIKRGDEISENRTLLEENGKKKEEKQASLKTKKFFSHKPIFGPVGLLAWEWHATYDYEFVKEDMLDGVKAAVIEVRPKVLIEGKPNYGKIWVALKDGSVLRIDIEQESLVGFEEIQAQAEKNRLKPLITTSHFFGFEKNGLRFPSRTIFEESYVGPSTPIIRVSRTVFSYEE